MVAEKHEANQNRKQNKLEKRKGQRLTYLAQKSFNCFARVRKGARVLCEVQSKSAKQTKAHRKMELKKLAVEPVLSSA